MANNALLFNAAFVGYLGGLVAGQNLQDSVSANYATLVTQATAFATQLDSIIANDLAGTPVPAGSVAISINTGAAIPPTTAAITESQAGKLGLIQQLSFSVGFQHFTTGQLAAAFAVPAAAIRALYLQAVPVLVVI